MARTLTETPISNKEQRKRLKARAQPYWRQIDTDIHLGYRKGKRGGRWIVRRYLGDRDYEHFKVGIADDEVREGTLAYDAAVKRAKQIVEQARRDDSAEANGLPLTVSEAIQAYILIRDSRDSRRQARAVRSDASSRLGRYVIGRQRRGQRKSIRPSLLATVPLHKLTERDLLNWRADLPKTLKGSTKKRLFSDVKAALNQAYADNRSRLPSNLPTTIKYGLRALGDEEDGESVARENQILTDPQVSRLIGAASEIDDEQGWEGALYRLVVLLAATGSRMSQLVRLRVGDVDLEKSRLLIPASRKGRGKSGSTPVRIGSDVLEALRPAIEGRAGNDILLERWRSRQVAGSIRWERIGRGPWKAPSELARPWAAIRRLAEIPEAIPYSLRHSSIVRQLRLGQPTSWVAKLHDTSIAMIERHYGRYIADALDEIAARGVVPLIPS